MTVADLDASIVKAAEATLSRVAAAREAIGAVIFGQEQVVEQALVTLLAGWHGLLIGVPGLAKTKLVETLGIVMGLEALRVQFTPDLMPSDILGSEVIEEDTTTGKPAVASIIASNSPASSFARRVFTLPRKLIISRSGRNALS